MEKILYVFLLCLLVVTTHAQQNSIRLIVRGDDMGYTHSGNEALIKCYKEGIQTSIEVIVPSPWFPEAVKLLKQNPGSDIGIHLALTSEWDNLKWRPIADCPSLTDSNGYFYPMVYSNKNYPGQAIIDNAWAIEDVEKEFRAQIEMAMQHITGISHVSSHMNCGGMTKEIAALTKRLAKEYGIDIDPADYGVEYVRYAGLPKTSKQKIKSLMNMLRTLQPGKTYMFVDHPGIDNDELRAVSHIGYEDVAQDRQGVTDAFTSKKVKAFIKKRGIVLIGYDDLKNTPRQ